MKCQNESNFYVKKLLRTISLLKQAVLDCMLKKRADLLKKVNLMKIFSVDDLPWKLENSKRLFKCLMLKK